ncbi:DUF2637 domain-containing protein [Metallococcus carri]|uniref:DUF2637 domain-containing protein n=1 Tax=Metallococcus carri TaxID=1656884 RepID=UPI001F3A417C
MAVAVTGTVFIALGAFWLSFTSLSDLARRCGIGADRSWVWPLLVDGVIVIATVSVVALTGTGQPRRAARYPWTLLLAGAGVSVLANASHAVVAADARVPAVLAALVAAVPPIVLVATTHLTVQLTHHPVSDGHADLPLHAGVTRADAASPDRGVPATETRKRLTELPNTIVAAPNARSGEAVQEALRLRTDRGLTNRQIAAHLGVHPSTVGRWLKSTPARQPSEVPSAEPPAGAEASGPPELSETATEQAGTERSPAL